MTFEENLINQNYAVLTKTKVQRTTLKTVATSNKLTLQKCCTSPNIFTVDHNTFRFRPSEQLQWQD